MQKWLLLKLTLLENETLKLFEDGPSFFHGITGCKAVSQIMEVFCDMM